MSPTYENGQLVIIKKEKVPQRGNLIIFEAPEWGGQSDKLIKRIIGLEGDEVYIDEEDLIINEVKQEHLKYNCIMNETQRIFIKKDEYLVMGDNKQNSNDSIYRFCNKEEEFKIHKDNIYITGKEFLVIRRLFNE